MLKNIFLIIIAVLLAACSASPTNTPTAEPLGTPTSPSKAACSTPSTWTIEYHRTGGFGGFDQSLTLKSDGSLMVRSAHPSVEKQLTLPEDHLSSIADLLAQACPFPVSKSQATCADCFVYDLNITMDGQTYNVQANDNTLTSELQPLTQRLDQFLQMISQ